MVFLRYTKLIVIYSELVMLIRPRPGFHTIRFDIRLCGVPKRMVDKKNFAINLLSGITCACVVTSYVLESTLALAKQTGWTIVKMKNDWRNIVEYQAGC